MSRDKAMARTRRSADHLEERIRNLEARDASPRERDREPRSRDRRLREVGSTAGNRSRPPADHPRERTAPCGRETRRGGRGAAEDCSKSFKALSADALRDNNKTFLELAQTSFGKLQENAAGRLEAREKAITAGGAAPDRVPDQGRSPVSRNWRKSGPSAYGGLSEQIKNLLTTQGQLQSQTGNLVRALRAPAIGGRWGEIQLKRVVEMAGMVEHCDFTQQDSVTTEDGRLRPDLIVRLPGGKQIVVDSKAPLQAYLDATEAT